MESNWISPIIFQIGPIALHWYGLMYAITFFLAYLIFQKSRPGQALPLTNEQKDNLLLLMIGGLIIGARLFYIFVYNFHYYLNNPVKILALWEGGLSFHGGLLGAILGTGIYLYFHNKKPTSKVSFFQITDLAALITPIGIFLGRLGNFINAELYGRISPNNQFCFYFPSDPKNCRYPSQLIEGFFEGLVLFLIIYLLSYSPLKKHFSRPGQISGIFLIFYGLFRFIIENFREPDAQIGFILNLTMGQILSIITIFAGLIIYRIISRNHAELPKK